MDSLKTMLVSSAGFFLAALAPFPTLSLSAQESSGPSRPAYDFRIETGWITLPDRVRLSARTATSSSSPAGTSIC